jgi:hypothetical protein
MAWFIQHLTTKLDIQGNKSWWGQDKSQNRNILLFLDQCAAQLLDTSYLNNVKVVFFPKKLHQHPSPIWPGNKQVIQTLLPQATYKKNCFYGWLQAVSWCNIHVLHVLHCTVETQHCVIHMTILQKCGLYLNQNHDDKGATKLSTGSNESRCSISRIHILS